MESKRGQSPASGPRRQRTRRGIAGAVALVVTAAAAGVVPTPAGAQSLTATNLAIAGSEFVPLGSGRFAFLVDEDSQGSGDRNGDGDAADRVLGVWDPVDGTLTNLALALDEPPVRLDGGELAFAVSEDAQGGADRNGNGSTTDHVVAVWDPMTDSTTNLALVGWSITPLVGGGYAFLVPEAADGIDRNGDEDTFDQVVAIWQGGNEVANLGVAANQIMALEGGRLAVQVPEAAHGAADRNGDGDVSDDVTAVWDPATGLTSNLGVASYPVAPLADGRLVLVVPESQEGTDRNNDDDTGDPVVAVWDPATGLVVNSGVAVNGAFYILTLGDRFAFTVPEAIQGNADRNGDLDTVDEVLAVAEVRGDLSVSVTSLGLVTYYPVALDDGSVAFTVPEADQGGVDRNGDGDAADTVIARWDQASGIITNLGLAGRYPVALDGADFAYSVQEWAHGGTDRNADGDASDEVIAAWNPVRGFTSLGIASYDVTALEGGGLAFAVYEPAQGADRNGDGDASDFVAAVWDPAGGTTNLGIARPFGPGSGFGYDPVALEGGGFALGVSEADQGSADRNGDADTLDAVTAVVAAATPGPAVSVETASLPDGTVGTPYEATLVASGGAPPYTWEVTSGSLPAGLTLDAHGVTSGTPTGPAEATTFTVTVSDAGVEPGTDSAALTIAVERGATALAVDPGVLRLSPLKLTAGSASARLSGGSPNVGLPNEGIVFRAGTSVLCSAVTGPDGTATCALDAADAVAVLVNGGITASYAGSASWLPSSGVGGLVR